MENNLELDQKSLYDIAKDKSEKYGFFSLTAEDHEALGGTPGEELLNNPGKAQYEVISDEEIIRYLDGALESIKDPVLVKNGYAQIQKDFFTTSIPFLKSVGRLPEKYKGFDLNTLSNLG